MALINQKLHKVTLGIVCLVPAAYLSFSQFSGGESILGSSVEVVSVAHDILPNTIISESDLVYIDKSQTSVEGRTNLVTDPYSLIGMETTSYLVKDSILLKDFFTESELNLKDDECIVAVPNEWVLSSPQSIRRRDTVYFYAVEKDDGTNEVALPEITDALIDAFVYYVKDSNNREVIDTTADTRYDGSSNVSNIEIKCTKEQLKILKEHVSKGYQFLIAYN